MGIGIYIGRYELRTYQASVMQFSADLDRKLGIAVKDGDSLRQQLRACKAEETALYDKLKTAALALQKTCPAINTPPVPKADEVPQRRRKATAASAVNG
jgi:hypothetical protein